MKTYTILISIILLLLGSQLKAQNSELSVIIKNIELVKGQLWLSMSNDSTNFIGIDAQPEYIRQVKVDKNEMVFTFKNIKDGYYAISVYQDLNENGELDTKKFGIPAEPFAFSNGALRRFAPPYFEQAKFKIEGNKKHEHILHLIYRKPKKKE